jgi:hypothetical protein
MLFNGESREWRATIEVLERGSGGVCVGIHRPADRESPLDLTRKTIFDGEYSINQANYVGRTPCLRFCKMQILR